LNYSEVPTSIQKENNEQVTKRIEDWKCRLIDLSKRNNLLFLKQSKRGNLAITTPDARTVFNKLVIKQNHLEFWVPPEESTKPSQMDITKTSSTNKQITQPSANQLLCESINKNDLEKILKNLHRRSLSDYRERGVRILHATFGILNWKDIITSEEIRSPLIVVPIEINRETIRKPYSISVPQVEEEAVLNPALQVKLKNDYKIELPTPPEDWETDSLTNYLSEVAKTVADLGWTVETTLNIGLFSFHKLVIYKDLDANSEIINRHPMVRAIAGVRDSKLVLDQLPEEKDVDTIESPENTFRVLDADSSQRVSIDFALRGQSFVMQGPPGTGKSQTIANIISECIARGKSVLFVSDKMAALEVVYKRLTEVGLAHFCLELHSSKANKQEVVTELKRCLEEQMIQGKLPSINEFEKMKQIRNQLNDYVTSLHAKQPALQKSAYEVLGDLAMLQNVASVQIGLSNPGSLTPQKMHELEELMGHLKNVWQVVEEPDFPWRGYRGNRYDLEIRSELTTQLEQIISTINLLRIEASTYVQQIGLETPPTLEKINWIISLSNLLLESPRPEANWVIDSKIDQTISDANNYLSTINECQEIRNQLMKIYNDSIFKILLNISNELEQALSTLDNLIAPSSIKEGELLEKRQSLLILLKDTSARNAKWRQRARELDQLFGFENENITPERAKQLARLALLCYSENKPERKWFEPSYFQLTKDTVRKAKRDYQEFNELHKKLSNDYTDGIYDLDLDEYTRRYSGYQSALRVFSQSYRRDQKEIALLTHHGSVPKTVFKDLLEAKKTKAIKTEIESYVQTLREVLGHFYNGFDTNFPIVEKAIETTEEIYKLVALPKIPESLSELMTNSSILPQELRQAANDLNESWDKWEKLTRELHTIIPAQLPNSNLSIYQTPLAKLEEWSNETSRQIIPLFDLTQEAITTVRQQEPRNYSQLLKDLRQAEYVRRKEAEILNEKELLRARFGLRFSELNTNWNEIITVLQWTKKVQSYFETPTKIPSALARILSQGASFAPSIEDLQRRYNNTPKALAELELKFEKGALYRSRELQNMELEELFSRIKTLRDRVDDLQIFIDFKETKNRFSLLGIEAFFDRLVEQRPRGENLVKIFQRSAFQEWINNLYKVDSHLGKFRRENHEQLIAEFRQIDRELIKLASNMVIQEANARKPQGIIIQATDSEVNTLLKEAAKKRRLMPIRNLLEKIPNILPRIKPCFLMSPISVSQFLDSEMMKFDLVLFDEASQIVPEDAIGSVYRGKCVVVAGDNKQLPPTSFFQKSLIDDIDWDEMTDADVEVFDSILDECLGIGLPVKTLRWHYRSRHEDLIAFSNSYFYEGKLITFPSAEANHNALGVKLSYVPDGVYDRGGRRDNPREAEVVTDLVFNHFKEHPKKTLGVVTFSIAQMEAVEDAIEHRLDKYPDFEQFFREDRLEGFFVKNLENVQGDERDVMMFSIGYGRDQQNMMTMNFGPLNKPGGERRLNVAVTRAREKTVLVTSIKASDIDLDSTNAAGVATLHHYLKYAEKGPDILPYNKTQTKRIIAPLEEDVAEEIRRMDYDVDIKVGCSEYRIDIGVKDPANPGRYLLGVECDGPTYKSSCSARDRDRLREQVLNQLGWKIHRVWSPAWVDRKESEVRKLKEALEQQSVPLAIKVKEPDKQETIDENSSQKIETRKVQFGGIEKIGVSYKLHPLKASFAANIKMPTSKYPYFQLQKNEFHFPDNRAQQSLLLEELVREEGPIHFDYAAKRLASSWGLNRTGPKVVQAVKEAADLLLREKKLKVRGDFLWPPNLIDVSIRVPTANIPESKRLPEQIPPEEIENALIQISQYAIGISCEALLFETGKVFGFNRGGEKVHEVMLKSYQRLLRERKLLCINETVTIP
jgi:hypothetical protein